MDYSRKRWRILIASCFINLCVGSMYAWSIFATPMAEYLSQLHNTDITSANLAIVFVICNSVGPITMIAGGKINDTLGPRLVIFIGGLMFGGGMILCGFASQISHLIWAYGILTGLGLGMVYGATISTSIKFFRINVVLSGYHHRVVWHQFGDYSARCRTNYRAGRYFIGL